MKCAIELETVMDPFVSYRTSDEIFHVLHEMIWIRLSVLQQHSAFYRKNGFA